MARQRELEIAACLRGECSPKVKTIFNLAKRCAAKDSKRKCDTQFRKKVQGNLTPATSWKKKFSDLQKPTPSVSD
jgi:hypothetical protein